jgi:hypothetical protein
MVAKAKLHTTQFIVTFLTKFLHLPYLVLNVCGAPTPPQTKRGKVKIPGECNIFLTTTGRKIIN